MHKLRLKFIIILSFAGLAGCSSTATYESLSKACGSSSAASCFKAAEYVWTMRSSDLKSCGIAQKSFCIKTGESRKQAVMRLNDLAIEQNALSCINLIYAKVCLRAGSGLAIKGIDLPNNSYKPIANRAEKFFQRGCDLGSQTSCKLRGTTRRAGS